MTLLSADIFVILMRTLVFAGGKIAIHSEKYRDHAPKCRINANKASCYVFISNCYNNVWCFVLLIT